VLSVRRREAPRRSAGRPRRLRQRGLSFRQPAGWLPSQPIAAGDDKVGAGIGEDSGDLGAETTGGAGDEGTLVGEGDAVV